MSHFHPDHAGTVERLRRHGVTPLILERQTPYIGWLNEFFAQPKNDLYGDYDSLSLNSIAPLPLDKARAILADSGIGGEVIYTPGHSEDSISLIIRNTAFTGDLPPFETAGSWAADLVYESWNALCACGAEMIYPGHGRMYTITMR